MSIEEINKSACGNERIVIKLASFSKNVFFLLFFQNVPSRTAIRKYGLDLTTVPGMMLREREASQRRKDASEIKIGGKKYIHNPWRTKRYRCHLPSVPCSWRYWCTPSEVYQNQELAVCAVQDIKASRQSYIRSIFSPVNQRAVLGSTYQRSHCSSHCRFLRPADPHLWGTS